MKFEHEWFLRFSWMFVLIAGCKGRHVKTINHDSIHSNDGRLCDQLDMDVMQVNHGQLDMDVVQVKDGQIRCKHRQTHQVEIFNQVAPAEVLSLPSNGTKSGGRHCKLKPIGNGIYNSVVKATSDSKERTKETNNWICQEVKLIPITKSNVKILRKRFRRDNHNAPALNFLPDNKTSGSDAPSPPDLWFRPANDEYNAYPPAPLTDNDVGDWRWSQGGGDQEGQTIYNINGVTWLCRQFRQLECYPVLDNVDQGSHGLGNHIPLLELTTRPPARTTPSPKRTKPPKTTFCSRIIKFKAKDSAILKFNTFDGAVRVLLSSRRQGNEVMIMARILNENDMGLDITKNDPQIILDVTVDCDNINIIVDGVKYVKGYMFGRDGVRDLEIVGNLESTGMEPRAIEPPPQGRSRNDDKLLQRDGYQEVRVPKVNQDEYEDGRHSSVEGSSANDGHVDNSDSDSPAHDVSMHDDGDNDGLIDGQEDSNGDESDQDGRSGLGNNQDVVQGSNIDPLHVEGTGDVEVSLHDGRKNHVYQISRGPDDEVNVDILYAPNVYDNKSLIIENKDYNYTLVVTENNFQIIHHDTKRNVTYEHGLQASGVQGVNVDGQVRNTQVTFKEENEDPEVNKEIEKEPIPSGLVLTQEQTVSIYGNLCVDPCSQAADGSYWCTVKAGDSEQCGPKPGYTPKGDECTSECRKLEDPYYWCNMRGQPWQYCSPSHMYQEIPCENDSPRVMTMEQSDCSRYFICEAGNIKLEECPVGLHFIHESQACEWPTSDNPCNAVSSKPSQSSRDDPRSLNGFPSVNEVTDGPTNSPTTAGITTPSTTASGRGEKVDGDTKTLILNEASNAAGHGLTSHGELCSNSCERRGYQYFWCKKPSSGLGQWSDSDFCSTHDSVTHYGEDCALDSQCEKKGEKYFWCYKTDGSWGYCSPQKIYRDGSCAKDGYYGLVGYCEHYVICTGGNPVVFSCLSGLYFDYTLLSCTTPDNAKCI